MLQRIGIICRKLRELLVVRYNYIMQSQIYMLQSYLLHVVNSQTMELQLK